MGVNNKRAREVVPPVGTDKILYEMRVNFPPKRNDCAIFALYVTGLAGPIVWEITDSYPSTHGDLWNVKCCLLFKRPRGIV